MSLSVSFHLTSGSRGHWGYDYYVYTCMNPDSAQFHNMASNLKKSPIFNNHHILWLPIMPQRKTMCEHAILTNLIKLI
jgi:hypothetical protein